MTSTTKMSRPAQPHLASTWEEFNCGKTSGFNANKYRRSHPPSPPLSTLRSATEAKISCPPLSTLRSGAEAKLDIHQQNMDYNHPLTPESLKPWGRSSKAPSSPMARKVSAQEKQTEASPMTAINDAVWDLPDEHDRSPESNTSKVLIEKINTMLSEMTAASTVSARAPLTRSKHTGTSAQKSQMALALSTCDSPSSHGAGEKAVQAKQDGVSVVSILNAEARDVEDDDADNIWADTKTTRQHVTFVDSDINLDGVDRGFQQPTDFRNTLIPQADAWFVAGNEGRSLADLSYMDKWIPVWAKEVAAPEQAVDTTCKAFLVDLLPIRDGEHTFLEAHQHPVSYPDVARSQNPEKAKTSTCATTSVDMIRESIRLQRQLRRALGLEVARPNPPKPKVEIVQYFDKEEPVHNLIKVPCYLRPAEKKDMQQITDILNYYITEVGHLEEHQPLSIQAVISKWEALREEGLPYIVAVAGDVPKDFKKVTHDKILGFANIGTYADILGRSNGRSRFTGLVEFFTHPKHLRLGIGCALLDRLLCISSTSYIEKCGYEFAMPHPKDHEHHTGAAFGGNPRRFHQLLIDRAFESKDDKDHEWFSYWLKEKFYCFEVARFRSMGRTSGKKERARWLDLCTFQLEVAAPEEFGVFS